LLGHTNIAQTQHYFKQLKNFKRPFQSETKQLRNRIAQNIKDKCGEKTMDGKLPCTLNEKLLDKEQSY
jgi:hypothetical protein